MKKDLLILEADKYYARKRIVELDDEIIALGPEFNKALTQTSESWHDNAPFEFVRDKHALLATELHNLDHILRNSLPSIPKQKKGIVGIGSKVQILNLKTNKLSSYFIAGDWTSRAGHKINESIIMSRKSPLALNLIGKTIDDEVFFRAPYVIKNIEHQDDTVYS